MNLKNRDLRIPQRLSVQISTYNGRYARSLLLIVVGTSGLLLILGCDSPLSQSLLEIEIGGAAYFDVSLHDSDGDSVDATYIVGGAKANKEQEARGRAQFEFNSSSRLKSVAYVMIKAYGFHDLKIEPSEVHAVPFGLLPCPGCIGYQPTGPTGGRTYTRKASGSLEPKPPPTPKDIPELAAIMENGRFGQKVNAVKALKQSNIRTDELVTLLQAALVSDELYYAAKCELHDLARDLLLELVGRGRLIEILSTPKNRWSCHLDSLKTITGKKHFADYNGRIREYTIENREKYGRKY